MPIADRGHIVFVNEASSLIGMGHILRNLVLAKIMHSRGYTISGITIGDEKAVRFAEERVNRERFAWPIRIVQNLQQAIANLTLLMPQAVVVDCSNASREIVHASVSLGIATVALDYFSTEPPLPAAIINLIDHHPSTIAGHRPVREGVDYFEGPQFAIIRTEFLEARERRRLKDERSVISNIVIAFGGADPQGNSQSAMDMLAQWPGRFKVDMVIGPLFASKIGTGIGNVEIRTHVSPKDMGILFENADLVFCGGGGTLLEALCVGTPAVVMAQNDAELRHAKSLAQRNACWIADEINWEVVSQQQNRKKRADCARACVDGMGADRIGDVIEQQL